MSFWDNIGAAVGVGASELDVTLDAADFAWGEDATGTVTLSGGRTVQQVTGITVAVVEHWTTVIMVGKTPVTQHHYKSHSEVLLVGGMDIGPGEQSTFRFSCAVPWGGNFSRHWFVGARASVPGAVDRSGNTDFRLVPPEVYQQVARVLSEVCRFPVDKWSNHASGVRMELCDAPEARLILDGVTLTMELEASASSIRGEVVVNPQEKNAADVLRSLVRADRQATEFTVKVGDVFSARRVFEAALRPHLDALRQFPVPAHAPTASRGDLPGASQEASEEA